MNTETTTTPQAKLRGLTAAFIAVLSLALVLAVTAIGYIALQGTRSSAQNGEALQRIDEVNERLIDCNTPTGECFAESQKRTAKAVVGVNQNTLRVIVAALSCQESGVTGQRALSRCTVARAKAASNG